MKKAIGMILLVMLVFCACGRETEPQKDTLAAAQDGSVTYTVYVQDEEGNPLAGVMVQLCKEVCIPGVTDAEGKAEFTAAADDYKVGILSMPEGYGYSTEETEFLFPEGSREITLVLKAA